MGGGLTFDAQEALLFIIGGLLKLIDDVSAVLRRHGGHLSKEKQFSDHSGPLGSGGRGKHGRTL